jgi:alkylation response protein AidB-like acyl-CoA dehydrogenase
MNFEWDVEHIEYRDSLRSFLAEHLPENWATRSNFDPGSDYVVEFARKFCPLLARHGLLVPHWPKDYGGGGAGPLHHWILGEELFGAGEPRSYQYMNVNWIGPALIRYGTDPQKDYHLRRITAGDVFWCQGFSEPSAGSDLASLKTRAERVGENYVINGSKIWTSAASFAEFIFLLARTGAGRREISVFLVPMATPGIEVREVASMTGRRSLHEVFLTDVVVAPSVRLGGDGEGWTIVRTVLQNERIGMPRYMMAQRALNSAARVLKQEGRFDDGEIQSRMGRAQAAVDVARLLALRVVHGRIKGRDAGPDTNVARYALVMADRAVGDLIGEFMHDALMAGSEHEILTQYRRAASTGLGAGSAEIQLNLVAQHFLELPRSA